MSGLKAHNLQETRRSHENGPIVCPVCGVDLLLSVREGVEIDCCPQCGGMWLDHGELFRIYSQMSARLSKKEFLKLAKESKFLRRK